MSSFQQLWQSLGEAKVRSVGSWAIKNLNTKSLGAATSSWANSYGKRYFKTGSAKPIVHLMIGLGVLGYILEYPHLAGMLTSNSCCIIDFVFFSSRATAQTSLDYRFAEFRRSFLSRASRWLIGFHRCQFILSDYQSRISRNSMR